MHFSLILGLGLAFWASEILVLKNGKRFTIDHYEIAGERVTLFLKGQTFSLPQSQIDWPGSKQAMADRAKAQAAAQAAESERLREAREKAARKEAERAAMVSGSGTNAKGEISLTTRETRTWRKTETAKGPRTASFRKAGNSIVVNLTINGNGPHNFILDTGASITLIDPDLLAILGIAADGDRAVPLVGVSGDTVAAATCILNEVSLGGARVSKLRAVVRRIPQLALADIHGLLGQDFLNHFVVNLDSSANTITLTPHGQVVNNPDPTSDFVDPNDFYNSLRDTVTQLQGYYTGYTNSQREPTRAVRELKALGSRLLTIIDQSRSYLRQMREVDTQGLAGEKRQAVEKFLRCHPLLDAFIFNLNDFHRELTRAYANSNNADHTKVAAHLDSSAIELDKTFSAYFNCQ